MFAFWPLESNPLKKVIASDAEEVATLSVGSGRLIKSIPLFWTMAAAVMSNRLPAAVNRLILRGEILWSRRIKNVQKLRYQDIREKQLWNNFEIKITTIKYLSYVFYETSPVTWPEQTLRTGSGNCLFWLRTDFPRWRRRRRRSQVRSCRPAAAGNPREGLMMAIRKINERGQLSYK